MQQIDPNADASIPIGDKSRWDSSDTAHPPVTVPAIVHLGACSQPGAKASSLLLLQPLPQG